MKFVRDLPIKRKLLLVTLATCGAALALACSALFWFQSDEQSRGLLPLYAAVLVSVLIGALLVILLVSSAMQRTITGPIAALAAAARNVSEKEDYSTRAPVTGHDEVGLLTRTFNQMLDQIQSRDQRLRERADRAVRHQSVLLKLSQLETLDWEEQVRRILPETARFLSVERVSFWRLEEGKQLLVRQIQFVLNGTTFESEPVRLKAADASAYFSALCLAGQPLVFDDALNDPTLLELAPGYLTPLGITSMLDAPVSLDGQVFGVVCCEHVGPRRNWTTEEGEFARAAAQQVALALEGHERRRAEDSLRQSEIRYRTLVESVKEVIFQTNATGEWIFLNSAWTEITGHEVKACLGRSYQEFVHAEDQARCLALVQPVLERREEGCRGEVRFQTNADEVRWIELLAQVTYDGEQEVGGLSGTLTDITARKAAEAEMARLNRDLVDTSRHAGMAEIATGVLHNVGNVLNSVNVSAALIMDQLRRSKVDTFAKAAQLLQEHRSDLAEFLARDPKGKQLPAFIEALAEQMVRERAAQIQEMSSLQQNIDHIKQIVAMQQSYAKVSKAIEQLDPCQLVEESLRIVANALARHQVELVREFESVPAIHSDRHKVLQIMVNLISNATQALDQRERGRRLTLRVKWAGTIVRVEVADNGMGIASENLTKIFQHGFTTKESGHGFGLHSGANAAKELGGNLIAFSEGPGFGATFVLSLPVVASVSAQAAA